MHKITINDCAESFECNEDRHVLAGMVALGRKGIPVGCRGGGCGVCKVRVLHGECERRAMSRDHVSAEEEASGIALACRIYPRSDLDITVLGKIRRAFGSQQF